ncbi:MAG TPA: lanthionine synthetase LanC family protein [Thermoanaerobaculia bacterium]|jgi:serine/threonine-protein kinase|nr:lanthionine synthetase LanC family protein [Thermoanaerobaculia bacterium]
MAITDALLLPPDVLLIPVAELSDELRGQLCCATGDYAVTRPRSRTPSRVVDAQAAELLAEFKSPRTIVEAVLRYSRSREVDPRETLEQAYPLLQGLVGSGFLVPEGEAGAEGIHPALQPGDEIAGFEVLECVQGLEDTELHQVRGPAGVAALKIERPAAAGKTGLFEREAAILEHLAGDGTPRLLACGETDIDRRRYLAIEWLSGVDAVTAAGELRRAGDRAGLLALCRAIVRAYAGLHDRGVIHGDVHPRNVLVAADGAVRLIDFGIARWDAAPAPLARIWRGGVAFYFEPEYAAAARAGTAPPEASAPGEQYGLAALIYQMAAGVHYRDFSLEKNEMLRQIAGEPPLSFAARGIDPWPDLEAVLARALSKDPGDRFASLAELAAALDQVRTDGERQAGKDRAAPVEALLGRVLQRLGPESPLLAGGLPAAPRGSIKFGAAGIAAACLRLAQTREDAGLLSLAGLWSARALRDVDREDSFYNPEIELGPEIVGRVSPYHTANGLFCVQALVSHACGDAGAQREAIAAFLAGAQEPCDNPDLTLGRSGVLLAASLLLDTLTGEASSDLRRELTALGDGLLAGLWSELDAQPPIARCDRLANLGIAHGWAGYLYATLRWCRSAGTSHPVRLAERLAELATTAQPWGRGLRWPWYGVEEGHRRNAGSMPGWCNGSAGFVFLWTLAHRELGDPAFRALAEGAAWNAWESLEGGGSLCCGLGGRAYALLNLHRHGGGPEWLARARALANRAALDVERASEREDSLYKGAVGVALLAADLARPETAAMPFFEDEGWC